MKLLILLLFLVALPAFSEDKQPDEKLCSIKTVFIEGHGGMPKWYRANLEKLTWLKVESVMEKADAIFEVGGVGSAVFPIKATLMTREPKEYLWEGTSRTNPLKLWGIDPRPGLLKKLNEAANCPKP